MILLSLESKPSYLDDFNHIMGRATSNLVGVYATDSKDDNGFISCSLFFPFRSDLYCMLFGMSYDDIDKHRGGDRFFQFVSDIEQSIIDMRHFCLGGFGDSSVDAYLVSLNEHPRPMPNIVHTR